MRLQDLDLRVNSGSGTCKHFVAEHHGTDRFPAPFKPKRLLSVSLQKANDFGCPLSPVDLYPNSLTHNPPIPRSGQHWHHLQALDQAPVLPALWAAHTAEPRKQGLGFRV